MEIKSIVKKIFYILGFKINRQFQFSRVYRPKNPMTKAHRIFDEELVKTTNWMHTDIKLNQLETSRYYKIWKRFDGGHKKYSYFHLYDRLFTEFADKDVKVLEIGVFEGASIRTWKDYFGKDSTIVGIDVNPECAKFEQKEKGIHVRIGDQSDLRFLEDLHKEFGEFDIIIDDGSHFTHHVIKTFKYAFLHCLSNGGIYFIEDLNTSYWDNYITSPYSGMDLVLNLCEMLNEFYIDHKYKDYARENYPECFRVPLISTLISEVRVFDSAAAVYKEPRLPPLVFRT